MPYRIALVAMLATAAVWFTFLRPKPPEDAPPPPAPGMTGLGNAVGGAKSAAGAASASAAQRSAAADAVEPAPATPAAAPAARGAAAKPAKAAKRPAAGATTASDADASAPLLRQIDRGHVVVLLFSSRRGSDDAAVRAAVRALPRHGGRVVVERAPLSSVGRYEAITRGVKILAAPTVLVIGKGPTARPITGFATAAEIDQAVGDMLAAGRRR
jgi:hypothetical protein